MVDRRASGRLPFPYQQRMAAAESRGEVLAASSFDWQLCHDVSLGGCSFWSATPRLGQRLWIELGFDLDCLTRLAEMCHETRIQCLVRPLFLVGCRFIQPMVLAPGAKAGEN